VLVLFIGCAVKLLTVRMASILFASCEESVLLASTSSISRASGGVPCTAEPNEGGTVTLLGAAVSCCRMYSVTRPVSGPGLLLEAEGVPVEDAARAVAGDRHALVSGRPGVDQLLTPRPSEGSWSSPVRPPSGVRCSRSYVLRITKSLLS